MYIDFHSSLVLSVKTEEWNRGERSDQHRSPHPAMSSFFKQSSGGAREDKRRREEVSIITRQISREDKFTDLK